MIQPPHQTLRAMAHVAAVALLGVIIGWSLTAEAGMREDAFIAGYAASAIKNEFGLRNAAIMVKDGVVTITTGSFSAAEQYKVRAALDRIKGVKRVVFVEGPLPHPSAADTPDPLDAESLRMDERAIKRGPGLPM